MSNLEQSVSLITGYNNNFIFFHVLFFFFFLQTKWSSDRFIFSIFSLLMVTNVYL